MTTPNMSSITASLERSLQNFSLNHHHHHHHHHHHNTYSSSGSNSSSGGAHGGAALHDDLSNRTSETSFDLNSHVSLPYHWEQCLDLKTGELYYINWRTGMKAKEDPRTSAAAGWNGDFYEDSEDDASSYDTEDSSTEESSRSFSRNQCSNQIDCKSYSNNNENQSNERGNVLVVAGCKSCMMYFMVPKQGEDCPKCSAQLLHFDKSETPTFP